MDFIINLLAGLCLILIGFIGLTMFLCVLDLMLSVWVGHLVIFHTFQIFVGAA